MTFSSKPFSMNYKILGLFIIAGLDTSFLKDSLDEKTPASEYQLCLLAYKRV